jgi:hypothetical protein
MTGQTAFRFTEMSGVPDAELRVLCFRAYDQLSFSLALIYGDGANIKSLEDLQ